MRDQFLRGVRIRKSAVDFSEVVKRVAEELEADHQIAMRISKALLIGQAEVDRVVKSEIAKAMYGGEGSGPRWAVSPSSGGGMYDEDEEDEKRKAAQAEDDEDDEDDASGTVRGPGEDDEDDEDEPQKSGDRVYGADGLRKGSVISGDPVLHDDEDEDKKKAMDLDRLDQRRASGGRLDGKKLTARKRRSYGHDAFLNGD